jgi:hypothetical protein
MNDERRCVDVMSEMIMNSENWIECVDKWKVVGMWCDVIPFGNPSQQAEQVWNEVDWVDNQLPTSNFFCNQTNSARLLVIQGL